MSIVNEAMAVLNKAGFHVAIEDDFGPRATLNILPQISALAPVALIHNVYLFV